MSFPKSDFTVHAAAQKQITQPLTQGDEASASSALSSAKPALLSPSSRLPTDLSTDSRVPAKAGFVAAEVGSNSVVIRPKAADSRNRRATAMTMIAEQEGEVFSTQQSTAAVAAHFPKSMDSMQKEFNRLSAALSIYSDEWSDDDEEVVAEAAQQVAPKKLTADDLQQEKTKLQTEIERAGASILRHQRKISDLTKKVASHECTIKIHGSDTIGGRAKDSIGLLRTQIEICESEVRAATTTITQLRAAIALINKNLAETKLAEGKGGYRAAGLHNLTRQDSYGNPTTDL